MRRLVPQSFINTFWHLPNAILAALWYGFPGRKLILIGVTGTDGKTTTTNLLYHILTTAGYKTSMISTIKAIIGDKAHELGFHVTSPAPFDVQRASVCNPAVIATLISARRGLNE